MQSSQMRPLGVTIIAILVALGGVGAIITGLVYFAIFTIIVGVLELALWWGLWTLKPWAFWATVILEAISVILAIIGLAVRQGNNVFNLIIPIVVLVYMLMDRNVRAAFRT